MSQAAGKRQYSFDQVLGFRSRNQHRGTDQQIQSPELLVTGNVLRRHSAGALVHRLAVAR
jgi:hypothetical protein